jgi:DNA modification methylase
MRKLDEVMTAARREPERYGSLVEEMDRNGRVDRVWRTLRAERKRLRDPAPDVGSRDASRYKLIIGDNLEVLADWPSDSVDLVLTSPPYGGLRRETAIVPDHYVDWFLPRARQFLRVLKPTGSFILNLASVVVRGERHPFVHELLVALKRDVGFFYVEDFFWAKPDPMPGAFGKRATPAVEFLFWLAKSRDYCWNDDEIRVPYRSRPHLGTPKSHLRSPAGEERDLYQAGGAMPTNLFTWPSAHARDGASEHSAVFPLALPMWFIRAGCPPAGVVMDPFAGSGTTGEAALRLGRQAVLVEREAAYESVIRARLQHALSASQLGQTDTRDDPSSESSQQGTAVSADQRAAR